MEHVIHMDVQNEQNKSPHVLHTGTVFIIQFFRSKSEIE